MSLLSAFWGEALGLVLQETIKSSGLLNVLRSDKISGGIDILQM